MTDIHGKQICPHCGKHNDTASKVLQGDDPLVVMEEGDVSICIRCASPSIFTGNGLEVRKPTEEEWEELHADEDIKTIIMTIRDENPRKGYEQ